MPAFSPFFPNVRWLSKNTAWLYIFWVMMVAPKILPGVGPTAPWAWLRLCSLKSFENTTSDWPVLRPNCQDRQQTCPRSLSRESRGKFSLVSKVLQSRSSVADHRACSLPRVPFGPRASGPLSFFLPHVPPKCCCSMALQQKATWTGFGKAWNPDVNCVWAEQRSSSGMVFLSFSRYSWTVAACDYFNRVLCLEVLSLQWRTFV